MPDKNDHPDDKEKKQKEEKIAQQKIIVDSYQQEFDENRFRDSYPALYRELKSNEEHIGLKIDEKEEISQLKSDNLKEILGENAIEEIPRISLEELERRRLDQDPLASYDPDIIDFIRRAKKPEEAVEVIQFLENRGEITSEQAKQYLEQLETRGLDSFGTHKIAGYYYRHAKDLKVKRAMKKLKKGSVNSKNAIK
ncbi:MAG: DUF2095 family protein [Candidatus Hodarchaeales archaeon]